jgi:hypothetical protein
VSTPEIESERARAIRNMRARKNARARLEKTRARRLAAIRSGDAVTVTPREYAELSGLSLYTIYRRVWTEKLRFKRDGSRILIFRDQLG